MLVTQSQRRNAWRTCVDATLYLRRSLTPDQQANAREQRDALLAAAWLGDVSRWATPMAVIPDDEALNYVA